MKLSHVFFITCAAAVVYLAPKDKLNQFVDGIFPGLTSVAEQVSETAEQLGCEANQMASTAPHDVQTTANAPGATPANAAKVAEFPVDVTAVPSTAPAMDPQVEIRRAEVLAEGPVEDEEPSFMSAGQRASELSQFADEMELFAVHLLAK